MLRFVLIGESVVSDWDYPAATSARALMRALTKAGHEATFLEKRKNRPTVELLKARGSAALRAFANRYPDLRYRTYELPTGLERTVWFVRQTATADAVILLDGTPAGIDEEAARLDARHLCRVVWSANPELASTAWADLRLSPLTGDEDDDDLRFGPMVESQSSAFTGDREDVLIVAYDDRETAETARAALNDFVPRTLSAGAVDGDTWPFVPEVDLPAWFERARLAVIVGAGDDAFAAARSLLPVAAGCPAIRLNSGDSRLSNLPATVAQLLAHGEPATVPADNNAAVQAGRLTTAVRRSLLARHR